VESGEDAAVVLAQRYAGTMVEVVHADATALPFPAASFDSAAQEMRFVARQPEASRAE
jgi:ubiquinone/menaquinone biosynthesis C-methylase UbiE